MYDGKRTNVARPWEVKQFHVCDDTSGMILFFHAPGSEKKMKTMQQR